MESRRQFIPRAEGDPELTQAELDAQEGSEKGKVSKFIRTAAFAAALGAAGLHPEALQAQDHAKLEKLDSQTEKIRAEMLEEYRYEGWLEVFVQHQPNLRSLMEEAKVQEDKVPPDVNNPNIVKCYIYLPRVDTVLTIDYDRGDEAHRDQNYSLFYQETLEAMIKSGLLKVKTEIVPNQESK